MLTDQELQRAVQSLVDDWHPTYPTPWPLLHWLDALQTELGGGVHLSGKFLKAVLPSPEWWDWFFQMAMHIGFQKWGETFCKEWLNHVYADAAITPTKANVWLFERDERMIVMMRKFWFPQWQPPEIPQHQFPTKGIEPQTHAPTKDVFR